MSTKLDIGQICSTQDILDYLDECINNDGLTPEDLIPWLEDVTYCVKQANEEFQRKYGGY